MDTPQTIINQLLNSRVQNDATNDDIRSFLIAQGKDANTVDAAIAQLDAHGVTRIQFLAVFGY